MPKGYHHVTLGLRCQISELKAIGLSLRKIAKQLTINVSTVSREIARNTTPSEHYRPVSADLVAKNRKSLASKVPGKMTDDLKTLIKQRLIEDQWSPDQISGRFKIDGIAMISHESIYQYVWTDKKAGGSLYEHLRHHGKKYNKRSSGKAGRGCIPNRVDISERPAIVETKSRLGDFEADTIISAGSRTALFTIVDRKSKFTKMEKIGQKTAENTHNATVKLLKPLPNKVLTITYDNGSEFADHEATANALKAKSYFARAYHSWERGLNEHTNGLIRQYLPKKEDFANVEDKKIQEIENKLNNRPRKVLGYKTPAEVFFAGDQSMQGVALQT